MRTQALTVYGFPIPSSQHCSKKRKRIDSNDSDIAMSRDRQSQYPSDWCTKVIKDMFREPGYRRPSPQPGVPPQPSPAWDVKPLPPPEVSPGTSVAWLAVGPHIRGKFLVQKAKALGIRPGKDFGLLANGQSVTVGDRVVQPEECLEPGQDPGVSS